MQSGSCLAVRTTVKQLRTGIVRKRSGRVQIDGRNSKSAPCVTKGALWYSGSNTKPNTIVRFDPGTEKFQTWVIPGGGDIVRNMAVTREGNPVMANSLVNAVGLVSLGE